MPAAIPHLQRAQQIDPSQYAVGYDLAVALIEVNRLDDARAQVRRLLKLKDVGEVHNLLGDLEERAGNLVAAAEAYQRASHMDPSEENLFDWGNNLLQLRAYGAGRRGVHGRDQAVTRARPGCTSGWGFRSIRAASTRMRCSRSVTLPIWRHPIRGPISSSARCTVSRRSWAERSRRGSRKFVAAYPKNALAHFHYAMSLWKGGGQAPESDDLRRDRTAAQARGGARSHA